MCWILGTIKRELNLFELCDNETVDDLHDEHDKALAYWMILGTNIILICYVNLSSQDMSSKLDVRQGRSS
jgi:hypothetical protein